MAVIPLFPLSKILFPHGRLQLQIFEPRYLDLVTASLRQDAGFGLMLIKSGHEVARVNDGQPPEIHPIGTYAKITDWSSLDNGRLGITITGMQKVKIESGGMRVGADHLLSAEAAFMEADPAPLPLEHVELQSILEQMLQHPMLERFTIVPQFESAEFVSCLLAQYLPITEEQKYQLLCLDSTPERLEQLQSVIRSIGG